MTQQCELACEIVCHLCAILVHHPSSGARSALLDVSRTRCAASSNARVLHVLVVLLVVLCPVTSYTTCTRTAYVVIIAGGCPAVSNSI